MLNSYMCSFQQMLLQAYRRWIRMSFCRTSQRYHPYQGRMQRSTEQRMRSSHDRAMSERADSDRVQNRLGPRFHLKITTAVVSIRCDNIYIYTS